MNFPEIKIESDDIGDYFDLECQKAVEQDILTQESPMSKTWSSRDFGRVTDRTLKIMELLSIREVVRNLARAHGAPEDLRITIAEAGLIGMNASRFEDPICFTGGQILLDPTIYEKLHPSEILDTYCGLTLHEAEHILESHMFFRRRSYNTGPSGCQLMFENMLEDVRIEESIAVRSPGYAPYVHATKRVMFERQELGSALLNWNRLPELDRILSVICAFVRTPYLLTNEMKEWKTITGHCVFEEIRQILTEFPATASIVISKAKEISDWYEKLIEKEKEELEEYSQDNLEPIKDRQCKADDEDSQDEACESAAKKLIRGSDMQVSSESKLLSNVTTQKDYLTRIENIQTRNEIESKRKRKQRFALFDAQRMQDRTQQMQGSLSRSETALYTQLDAQRAELTSEWKPDKDSPPVRALLLHPEITPELNNRYKARLANGVRKHVAAMRKALQLRLREVHIDDTELKHGKIHQRRLGRSFATNRVFHETHVRIAPGIHISLLIDESGSMASSHKIEIAKDCAACITEALRTTTGVLIDVYSFHSDGEVLDNNGVAIVRCLYTAKQKTPCLIETAKPAGNNHDYIAIHAVMELMLKQHHEKQMIIVMSDGKPCGPDAEKRTKVTVDEVRKRGIEIVQVAIEDFDSSDAMYGEKYVYRFTDLSKLVRDMRKLASRLVVGASR